MRKYLCVLMSIILCLTVFCACSNGKTANVAGSTNITSSTSCEQTTDAEEVTVTANEVQTTKKKIKKHPKKAKRLRLPLNLFQKKIIKKLPTPQKSRTASQKVILNQKAIQKLKRSILKKKSLPQTLRLKSRKQLCKKRMTIRLLKPPRLRLTVHSQLNVSQFSIIWTT